MGTAAVAYIALLASRLPWFLGGAAPAAAGAGYFQASSKITNVVTLNVYTWEHNRSSARHSDISLIFRQEIFQC